MQILVVAAVTAVVLFWLFRPVRGRAPPAPEDDVVTPIDQEELEEAERELREDRGARPLGQGTADDEDDWGPGTR